MMVIFGLTGLLALQSPAPLPEIIHGPVAHRMDTLLARASVYGFSGQVLIVRAGRPILHRAYGDADRTRGVPMELTTRLGIASISKRFTAAVLHVLEARGQLRLDDSLARVLPDVPASARNLTLRQVMTHTAGLSGGFADDFEDASLASIVRRTLERPLRWAPGQRWGYSTEGYATLALAAERAARMPWDRVLREIVFTPAGMAFSGTWRDAWMEGTVAHAYQGPRDNGSPATWPQNWRVAGGGDIVSTAADLYRWHLALYGGGVMPAPSLASYLRPGAAVDSSTRYGAGLFFWRTTEGHAVIEHGGDTDLGYNGAYSYYPERDDLLILLTNTRDWLGRSGRAAVQGELEAMLLGTRPDTVALPPPARRWTAEERQRLAGTWRLRSGGALHLVDDGALVWALAEGQDAVNLLTARSGAEAERLALATERSAAFFEAIRHHDLGAALRVAGDTTAERRAWLESEVGSRRERFGVVREYRVLGTLLRPGAMVTTVRVTSARHERYTLALRWNAEGRLRSIGPGDPHPVMLPVAASTDGSLLAYDVVTGRRGRSLTLEWRAAGPVLRDEAGSILEGDRRRWQPE